MGNHLASLEIHLLPNELAPQNNSSGNCNNNSAAAHTCASFLAQFAAALFSQAIITMIHSSSTSATATKSATSMTMSASPVAVLSHPLATTSEAAAVSVSPSFSSSSSAPSTNTSTMMIVDTTPEAVALAEVQDRLAVMHQLESGAYSRAVHAQNPFLAADRNQLWRRQMIDWMYSIVGYCKLQHEAVAAAAYYMDVAVSASQPTDDSTTSSSNDGIITTPQQYQCLALTALVLALKAFDSPNQRSLELDSLVRLGDGSFSSDDVVQMESQLLRLLKWKVHPPTPNCFVEQYLALMPDADTVRRIQHITNQVIAKSMASPNFVHSKSSHIAQAALGIAFQRIGLQQQDVDDEDDCATVISMEDTEQDISQQSQQYLPLQIHDLQQIANQWESIVQQPTANVVVQTKTSSSTSRSSSPIHVVQYTS